MNCLAARERLPERALAVLDHHNTAAVERHLEWCAGCRKEAAELEQAAALFGLALSPATPPDDLQERVVSAVQSAIGSATGQPVPRRRLRSAAASAVAAMVVVAALGWGAVMTGRADRLRHENALQRQRLVEERVALDRFRKVIAGFGVSAPPNATRLGQLAPTPGRPGGGFALMLVSPRIIDAAMVIVNGLNPKDTYRAYLENARGATLQVGAIGNLDAGGGGQVYQEFNRDLGSFTRVVVRNAAGAVVLQGTITPNSTLGA